MTDIRLLFPADYLSAPWLKGRDVTLTISRVFLDELKTDRGTEKKPVLGFAELDARRQRDATVPYKLVLNKTNAKTIAKALGSHDTDEWIGHRITLYPTTCLAFGATVECVRIRESAPAPKRGKQPEADSDPASDYDPETGEVAQS